MVKRIFGVILALWGGAVLIFNLLIQEAPTLHPGQTAFEQSEVLGKYFAYVFAFLMCLIGISMFRNSFKEQDDSADDSANPSK